MSVAARCEVRRCILPRQSDRGERGTIVHQRQRARVAVLVPDRVNTLNERHECDIDTVGARGPRNVAADLASTGIEPQRCVDPGELHLARYRAAADQLQRPAEADVDRTRPRNHGGNFDHAA
jgi:hypothetical protein